MGKFPYSVKMVTININKISSSSLLRFKYNTLFKHLKFCFGCRTYYDKEMIYSKYALNNRILWYNRTHDLNTLNCIVWDVIMISIIIMAYLSFLLPVHCFHVNCEFKSTKIKTIWLFKILFARIKLFLFSTPSEFNNLWACTKMVFSASWQSQNGTG